MVIQTRDHGVQARVKAGSRDDADAAGVGAGLADRLPVYFFVGVDVLQRVIDSLVSKHKMGQPDYGGIVFAGLRMMQKPHSHSSFPPGLRRKFSLLAGTPTCIGLILNIL